MGDSRTQTPHDKVDVIPAQVSPLLVIFAAVVVDFLAMPVGMLVTVFPSSHHGVVCSGEKEKQEEDLAFCV